MKKLVKNMVPICKRDYTHFLFKTNCPNECRIIWAAATPPRLPVIWLNKSAEGASDCQDKTLVGWRRTLAGKHLTTADIVIVYFGRNIWQHCFT